MDPNQAWQAITEQVRTQLSAPREREEFENLVCRGATPVKLTQGSLTVQLPNHHAVAFAEDQFEPQLREATRQVLGDQGDLELVKATPVEISSSPNPTGGAHRSTHERAPGRMRLDAHFTFDNFVVGACNRIAASAAKAVVDRPGTRWNPLYIYGASGLGKTHLLMAIGNQIRRLDPAARVVYVTADDFTHEFVHAIRHQGTQAFRTAYREEATVLLMDDIQFLSGAEATQEELFYVFNVMQQQQRQMVFTSDVEPRQIDKLETRLQTRFQGGQIVDMQPPDRETATAILLDRAVREGWQLPREVALAIADAASGNMREMLGYLNNLSLQCETFQQEPTLEFAQEALPAIFAPVDQPITVPIILEVVADTYNLRVKDLLNKKRLRKLTRPRHIAMFLARELTELSFPELGREFADRDHSTIQHGVRKIQELLDGSDSELGFEIDHIRRRLKSPPRM